MLTDADLQASMEAVTVCPTRHIYSTSTWKQSDCFRSSALNEGVLTLNSVQEDRVTETAVKTRMEAASRRSLTEETQGAVPRWRFSVSIVQKLHRTPSRGEQLH